MTGSWRIATGGSRRAASHAVSRAGSHAGSRAVSRGATCGALRALARTCAHAALLALPLLLACNAARADYNRAFAAYQAGRYDDAKREFLELAALGDHAAQMNLAAMARKGEAGPVDVGAAVGWILAATQNGSERMTLEQASKLRAGLSPEAQAAADAIVARYGRAALERDVLPDDERGTQCAAEPARPTHAAAARYPYEARRDGRDGVVLVEFTVGIDGLARDVRVIKALPELFARPVVRSILESRYAPARIDGEPVEVRPRMRHAFTITDGGVLWNTEMFAKLRKAADAGYPASQYLVGAIASLDPTVGVSRVDGEKLILDAAKGGHPEAQADIGRRFLVEAGCSDPRKARAWLEPAAREGDPVAAITMVALSIADGGDLPVERLRAWLATAAKSKNEYALKHALPWLAGLGPESLADPALALETAARLDEHGLGEDPQAFEARALALAANAQFPAAARLQKTAIARARDLSWNVSAMEERYASYSAGRAWRGDPYALPPQSKVGPSRTWRTGKVCTALSPLDCPASRTRPDPPPAHRAPLGSRVPED